MNKPILCLDFDGVCHSYTSGWKGAAVIPDPPVPGMEDFIVSASEHFDVCIFSSRSNQEGGLDAMREWFHYHAPGASEVIRFPLDKPPAVVGIDDRVLTFDGTWPALETLKTFQPWNKKVSV